MTEHETTEPKECDCPEGICVAWIDRALCREEHRDEEARKHLRSPAAMRGSRNDQRNPLARHEW